MSPRRVHRILVFEADPGGHGSAFAVLRDCNFKVECASSLAKAETIVRGGDVHLVVLSLAVEEPASVMRVVERACRQGIALVIAAGETGGEWLEALPFPKIGKPIRPEQLVETTLLCLANRPPFRSRADGEASRRQDRTPRP